MEKNFGKLDVGQDLKEVKLFVDQSFGILKQSQNFSVEEETINTLDLSGDQENELANLLQEFSAEYNLPIESVEQMSNYILDPKFIQDLRQLSETFPKILDTLENSANALPLDNQIATNSLDNIIPVFQNNNIRIQNLISFVGSSGQRIQDILKV
ncbi:MAG TPA: hypothetical protein VMZ91_13805 [Candidatus Paceibacterota bacterium]|nr:hypothetical protein [Candidatus Paceibacterota bacterium]